MGIFGKKRKELPPLMQASDFDIVPAQPDFDSVLEWLIGLSADDYAKVGKIADIHRKAYNDHCKVLGKPDEPTTFIEPPAPAEPPTNLLDDEDDITSAFLEDEPKHKKPTKIKVNQ